MATTSFFVIWLLISTPLIYYFFYYLHTYLTCALSTLLFFLGQTVAAVFFFVDTLVHASRKELQGRLGIMDCIGALLWILGPLLFASSMILAVVSTIVEWNAFHYPSLHNWFAWIIPHVSS